MDVVLGEDELAVVHDVELSRPSCCDRRIESLLLQLGRETRGPTVVPASDGAIEDLDAHRSSALQTRWTLGKSQGGGFGPTVQLKDGTLVMSYSYRGKDDKTHLEVVRWKLPAAQKRE